MFQYCNPMRRIDMKNSSGDDVKITWKLQERDSMYLSDFFISNSDEIEFSLDPKDPLNEVKMTFGVGRWTPAALYAVTERLESLEIRSAKGTVLLKSSEDIYKFLMNRRRGLTKRKILIMVTD
jgi:hypothetical protein